MSFTLIGADTTVSSGMTDAQMQQVQGAFTNAGNNALSTEIQFLPVFLSLAVIGLAVTLIIVSIKKVKRAGR